MNSEIKVIKSNPVGAVQGDVPIIRVTKRTKGGKRTAKRTVAYGETTGHHHSIVGEVTCYDVTREVGGQLFPGMEIVVVEGKPAHIEHNSNGEHNTIEMTPGIYFIPGPGHQQVEYDGENERRVQD